MKKKIPAILLAALLLAAGWLGIRYYNDYSYRRETVFLRQTDPVLLYIEPDQPETRAAANSLAYALKLALGTESAVITEKDDSLPTLQLIIGEEEAGEDGNPEYSIKKE